MITSSRYTQRQKRTPTPKEESIVFYPRVIFLGLVFPSKDLACFCGRAEVVATKPSTLFFPISYGEVFAVVRFGFEIKLPLFHSKLELFNFW